MKTLVYYYYLRRKIMKCPVCKDVTLLMSEKKGVEIDYCPECRGIWLDRGELEKIIGQEESRETEEVTKTKDKSNKKEKKESFLMEIFEMFGE